MSNKTVFIIFLLACSFITITCDWKLEKVMKVSTGAITDTTSNSATAGGQIIDMGEGVSQYGHYYRKTSDNSFKTVNGVLAGNGSFTSKLENLEAGIEYKVKAYISNGTETIYGEEIKFKTDPVTTIRDKDGNRYNIITIGTQIWMRENLKTTKYEEGDSIPLVTDNTAWSILSTPGYCWYDNNSGTYKTTYGALYNWYAVNTGKLCPAGWHVPADDEWKSLEMNLGMTQTQVDGVGKRGMTEGGKLKEAGLIHWLGGNIGSTNESDFTALPGGNRDYREGKFQSIGYSGSWWSATEYFTTQVWYRNLNFDGSYVYRNCYYKSLGFSVRCLRD